jgi:hypothetical protein
MPAKLPSANQIQTSASTTEDTPSTVSNTADTTLVVGEADAAGTAPVLQGYEPGP